MSLPSVLINIAIAALTVVAWLKLVFAGEADSRNLSQRGVASLKYFTVLSNLLSCVVSAIYVVYALATPGPVAPWLLALKLMAAASVMLTFLTVTLFLGPTKGWANMYRGGNFWMHLVLPLLAVADCCFFVPVGTLPFGATFLSLVPTFLYGVGYIYAYVKHRHLPNIGEYDFYGFFAWGARGFIVVATLMFVFTWGSAAGMWFASGLLHTAASV